VDVGGHSPSTCTNSCAINDRASFLPVKSSTVDLVNVLHGVLAIVGTLDDEVWYVIWIWTPPPTSTLASTRCHSRDRCSQPFPVLCALPLPCIILNENRRTKNGRGLGTWL